MKGLLHKFGQRCATDREGAMCSYRRLIQSTGVASDDDAAKLEQAARILGKNLDDVSRDLKAVATWREWAAQANTEAPARAEAEAATRALENHTAEVHRLREEHNTIHNRLLSSQMDAQQRVQNAGEAKRRASIVWAQHAEVLAGLDPIADAPTVYRITLTEQPGFCGQNERVHFQNGVGFTTDTASCDRFASFRGCRIDRVDLGTPPEVESAPPVPTVTATTTEPIAEPGAASVATEADQTAADTSGPASTTQTPAAATGELQAHEAEAARLRELGASHVGASHAFDGGDAERRDTQARRRQARR